jgi:hypothetical protein
MPKSDYAENAALTNLLTGTQYVGLCSATPTDAHTGTTVSAVELTGNGYARQAVTFTVSGSSATNAGAVTFTASGGAWSTATHIIVVSAATAGNIKYYGALTSNITLNNGESGTFAIGQITITED